MTQPRQPQTPDPLDEVVAALISALAILDQPEPERDATNWPTALAPQPGWSETGAAAWRDAERRRGWRT